MHQELEEVELCEKLSRQHLEDQIAEFQEREQQSCAEELVLCPLCNEANLLQVSSYEVACPNNMNGSCAMRLERSTETISLPKMRERLGTAYDIHASTTCTTSPLEFHLDDLTFTAVCHACDFTVAIA